MDPRDAGIVFTGGVLRLRIAISVLLLATSLALTATLASGGPQASHVRVGGTPVLNEEGGAGSRAEAAVPELLPLQTADMRIVDTAGRDVLLRGANINSLGEYWQGVPSIPATIPLTDADWDLMASRGFSVVRLIVTWSRVEPTRGVIDQAYLDEVDAAVTTAADHGIYTVIDMHQDAYSHTIFTTDPATCPPGTSPAKGWDGAPGWATLTDGLSTCLTGSDRNSSPAVNRAWNNFYDDVDGIRGRFAASWAAIAERFAGRPEVAGYDILNEPENPRPAAAMQPVYDEFLAEVITAIRAAESGAPFDHIVFVEPAIPAGDVTRGLVIPSPSALGGDTTNISASVHNYAETITPGLTLEQMNDFIASVTAGLGVPNWGGEYGAWSTDASALAIMRRYAADEDAHLWGGAWWQWRQSCGDPHAVHWSGGSVVPPTGTEVHLNLLGCPGNLDLGPNEAFLDILGRGYPRAAPGRLSEVRTDIDTGWLKVAATAGADDVGEELVVWTPTTGSEGLEIRSFGLTEVTATSVPGGRIITGRVEASGRYALWIGEPDEDVPTTTTSTTSTTSTSMPPTSTSTSTVVPSTSSTVATTGPSGVGSPGATGHLAGPSTALGARPSVRAATPARAVSAAPRYAG